MRLRFNTFGNNLKAQVVGHAGQVGDHDAAAPVVFDIADQAAIKLQHIKGQFHDL